MNKIALVSVLFAVTINIFGLDFAKTADSSNEIAYIKLEQMLLQAMTSKPSTTNQALNQLNNNPKIKTLLAQDKIIVRRKNIIVDLRSQARALVEWTRNNDCVLRSIDRRAVNVIVPRYVTQIAENAFAGCRPSLRSIRFERGSTLALIDNRAFKGLNIRSITIPDSVLLISDESFACCKSLREVKFGNNSKLKVIGKRAFWASALDRITVPNSVVLIDERAFLNCSGLQSVKFEENSSLMMIKSFAFLNTAINRIFLPKTLLLIDRLSFSACKNLKSVSFAQNSCLEVIMDHAFSKCPNLSSVTIPSSTKKIEAFAFAECSNISTLNFEKKNAQLQSIGDNAFYQSNKLFKVNLPNDTIIYPHTFSIKTQVIGGVYESLPHEFNNQ